MIGGPVEVDLQGTVAGGIFCPCHDSKFDSAGRVFKNLPVPNNLNVPSYYFIGGSKRLIA